MPLNLATMRGMKKQTDTLNPELLSVDPALLAGEAAERVWIPLSYARQLLWNQNPKAHDIGVAVQSFQKYGFRDNPAFDRNLTNVAGGAGAIVYGNGRIEALGFMHAQGMEPPRGIKIHPDSGEWYIPIEVGLDAQNAFEAAAFGIDHNATTLAGGNLGLGAHAAIFDKDKLMALLQDGSSHPAGGSLVFDEDDLLALLRQKSGPVFDGGGAAGESEYEGLGGSDIPDAAVRLVHLFLTVTTIQPFLGDVEVLRKHYGTSSVTETVVAAVREKVEGLQNA